MREIKLTQGKVAIVDDEDFINLSQWTWQAVRSRRTYYARRTFYFKGGGKAVVPLHYMILPPKEGLKSDHIDGNGLNNCRNNLRYALHAQNVSNSIKYRLPDTGCLSKYKGVTRYRDKWRGQIRANGNTRHLGVFASETEAALAYNAAAIKHFGEFAKLNQFKEVLQ